MFWSQEQGMDKNAIGGESSTFTENDLLQGY